MTSINLFLILDALFQGGRMFVGGVSIAFLLSRGLTVADVASIKTLQAIIVFIAEIPTGIIADKLGRKFGLLAGATSSLIGLLFYLIGHQLSLFLLGELFLALSLCWWSGSYEAWVCTETKIDKSTEQTKHFFHLSTVTSQSAVVTLGWLGGFLAGQGGYEFAYTAAIVTMILLLLLIIFIKETTTENHAETSKLSALQILSSAFLFSIHNRKVLIFVFLSIFIQFLAQPLLHYWQPLFLALNNKLGPTGLGNIFAISTTATAVASWGLRKIHIKYEKWLFLVWLIFYFTLSKVSTFYFAVLVFLLLMVGYIFLRTRVSAQVAHSAPANIRASVLSVNAFLSRLGMLGSLSLIHYLFAQNNEVTLQKYQSIFFTQSAIAICFGLLFVIIAKAQSVFSLNSQPLKEFQP